jgi:hypothetical protein
MFDKRSDMPKSIRLLVLGAAFCLCNAALAPAQENPPAAAQKLVGAAVAKAKAEKKVVFIHFSASW